MAPVQVTPLSPLLDPVQLAELRSRLSRTRWADLGDDWTRGVPHTWLRELVQDWEAFDVSEFQQRLEVLSHLAVDIDGQRLHAVHAPGQGPAPLPLLLTHGWPGTFCEYLELIPLLTNPEDPADAFTVVAPSLPGFGFSAPPPDGGLIASQVARLWVRLMSEGLGYARYGAHGSDLGAGVTAWLARQQPDSVVGIHLATPGLAPPPHPWSDAETAHFAEVEQWSAEEGGYAHQQATKPATLGAALADSPVGLAAWIGEKVLAWSSVDEVRGTTFPRDLLLATLTTYWTTETIGTSLLPYWAYRHNPGAALPANDPPPVPTAVSVFGGEHTPFPKPPRELAERYFRVTAWSEHDRGGHFPAVAEPALLAATLRDFFRPLRLNAK